MDSILKGNISNKNIQDSPNNNNFFKEPEFNEKQEETFSNNFNKQMRPNSSINPINKNNMGNNTGNFKIINLKQKLQDQILFANERKFSHLLANKEKSKSKPKNNESNNFNTRLSKGK